MKQILVVAPHPDDDTLGCGGTLLRHHREGDEIHWLIVTWMTATGGYSPQTMLNREHQVKRVEKKFCFSSVTRLDLPTTELDTIPMSRLVLEMSNAFKSISPNVLYLPHHGDSHTDHRMVFDAALAASKWFRRPSIERILCYETPSESGFGRPDDCFRPQVFVDIDRELKLKLQIFKIYAEEVGKFPFPRSEEALTALAHWRGSLCGKKSAEAFELIKDIR